MIKNKNNEQGRSMVEMLGVLAVIGVLSIGGIAGYTMAMNRHRANELLDGASKRAIVAMQQISLGYDAGSIKFDEFPSNEGFSGFPMAVEDGKLGIPVNGVKKAVCENLVGMKGDDVLITENGGGDLDPIEDADGCTDNINLVLVYDIGSGGGSGSGDDDDDDDDTPDCSAYTGTDPSYTGGTAGKATDGTTDCKCPESKVWESGTCKDPPLYVLGGTPDTHYNLTSNGADCPDGYHWASSSEVISDLNCTLISEGGEYWYECDSFSFPGSGWSSDCANWENYTQVSCSGSVNAAFMISGGSDPSPISIPREAPEVAMCRKN